MLRYEKASIAYKKKCSATTNELETSSGATYKLLQRRDGPMDLPQNIL
jgi:hypothetical protein